MKIIEAPPRFPILSFRDWELWTPRLDAALRGARVERILVPEIPEHPDGFWKHTFAIDLSSPASSLQLHLSLRPQECGVFLHPSRTFKPCPSAPRSPFLLGLGKHLTGRRIRGVFQVRGDRILRIEFEGSRASEVHLHLIPGRPLGVLLEEGEILQASDSRSEYSAPGERLLEDAALGRVPFHPEWFAPPEHWQELWFQAEQRSLLRLRKLRALHALDSDLHSLSSRKASLEEQLHRTGAEPDWARYGSALQAQLYRKPPLENGFYHVNDLGTGEILRVPGDPRLTLERQMEKYFHLAKRKKRRLQESRGRIAELSARLGEREPLRQGLVEASRFEAVAVVERVLGLRIGAFAPPARDQKKLLEFSGRQFTSEEGLRLLVGRNADENAELTFRIARGNDLWLHVKGRPGAHVVILLPPGRSASLETLLDAAHLCIVYSGGKDWGKTEVDYTFRKNVKKIRGQTEVSYSAPKTLSIQLDPARLKRLQA